MDLESGTGGPDHPAPGNLQVGFLRTSGTDPWKLLVEGPHVPLRRMLITKENVVWTTPDKTKSSGSRMLTISYNNEQLTKESKHIVQGQVVFSVS